MNNIRSPAPAASMFNLGINRKNNAINVAANTVANAAKTVVNTTANAMNSASNTISNTSGSMMNTIKNSLSNGPSASQIIILSLFVLIVTLFSLYWQQVQQGFSILYQSIRERFGATKSPVDTAEQNQVVKPPEAPQNDTVHETKLIEKILPGRREVFNISPNKYTYYDAEPLCKALGAELATYEQVKEAYGKGADWCNYGWVKGQMAVYPTQKATWEQIQNGPEDQRDACGRPGLNGGYFDNPELQFGVNCYGEKPPQKDHDATAIAAGEGAPLSPGALEFEKKVSKYRGEANYLAIMPFSRNTWSN